MTAIDKHPNAYTDAHDGSPQAVTLVGGNRLLRDVRGDRTSHRNPVKIQRNLGATLSDAADMFDDAAKTDTIDEIFKALRPHETMGEINVADTSWHDYSDRRKQ